MTTPTKKTATKKKTTSVRIGTAKVVPIRGATLPNAHKTVLPTTVIYGRVPKAPATSSPTSPLTWLLVGVGAYYLLRRRR